MRGLWTFLALTALTATALAQVWTNRAMQAICPKPPSRRDYTAPRCTD
jgi:hypothetical protein